LNIHGIRHILTPTLNYARLFYITDPPGRYIQYDRSIDARDLSEEILFRLRNRWQTKRGEPDHLRSVDFLTLDLDFNFFPGKAGSNLGRDDFIELNTKWRVNDNVTLSSSRTRYDLARSQFNLVNFGVELTYWQPIAIAYSHDFIRPPDPRRRTKSISTLKLAYRPTWSRWQIELQESYDFNGQTGREGERNPKVLSSAIALTRELHCWQLILSAEANKGWGANTSLSIHLRPTFLTARTVEL
jgi:hypothetical protein